MAAPPAPSSSSSSAAGGAAMSGVDRAYEQLVRRDEDKRAAQERLNNERDGRDRPDRVAELRAELDAANRQLEEAQAAHHEAQAAHHEAQAAHALLVPLAQARQEKADITARLDAELAKGRKADKKKLKRLEAALREAGAEVKQALVSYDKAVAARAGPAAAAGGSAAAGRKRQPPAATLFPLALVWNDGFSPSESESPSKKRRIAKFEPLRRLSKGDFGVVYRAKCVSVGLRGLAYGREYAVKLGDVQAEALRDLRDVPGVVQYVNVCVVADGAATEYATMRERGWLAEVMPVLERSDDALDRAAERSGLPRDKVLARWAAHLSAALVQMHERGWVHRDIKPSNILVDADKAPLEPMLSDFGCAAREGDDVEYFGTRLFTGDWCLDKYRGGGQSMVAEAKDDWESLELAVLWLSGARWDEKHTEQFARHASWWSTRTVMLFFWRERCEAWRVVKRAYFDWVGVPVGASVRKRAACE